MGLPGVALLRAGDGRGEARELRTVGGSRLAAFLVGTYAVLLPVQFVVGAETQFAPSDIFVLAYLALRLPLLRRVPAAWNVWQLALPVLFLFGLVVLAVRTGGVTQYALVQKCAGMLVLMATYACLVDFMRDWVRLRWLLSVFLKGVVVNVTASLVAFAIAVVGGPELPLLNAPYPSARLAGTLLDPNAYGGLLAVALLLHQLTARTSRPLLTGWWAVLANVGLPLGVVISFSRSAWIGLVAGLATAALLRPRATGQMLLRIAVPALAIGPVLLALFVPGVLDLITRPSQVESRLTILDDAMREFSTHPLVGIGLGAFPEKYGIIVHNTAMWFLAEFGLLGLAVFAGIALTHVRRLLVASGWAPPDQRPLVVALLVAHITMLGVSVGIEALYQRHWWLVMAAAGAAYALSRVPETEQPR